jgi:alkylated DNA repair dioxygenase AlkB
MIRARLRHCSDLRLIGFHHISGFLSQEERQELVRFCDSEPAWDNRLGSKGRSIEGTRQKVYGVTQNKNYKVLAVTELPAVLQELGNRVLKAYTENVRESPSACCGNLANPPTFSQVYVQRYTKGQTLGFHFDDRTQFGELIAGVTICGNGKLLLSQTNGGEEVDRSKADQDNIASVQLNPGSLYVMTGMSRYDFRHAAMCEGDEERISITFRSLACTPRRTRRPHQHLGPAAPTYITGESSRDPSPNSAPVQVDLSHKAKGAAQ